MFNQGDHSGHIVLDTLPDADWAGDVKDRRSTSGMIITVNRSAVAWHSRKQVGVALSSSEAEYIALSHCVREVFWIRQTLQELGWISKDPTVVHEGNIGAIKWGKSDRRTKHVEIRYHFVRDMGERCLLELQYCPTAEMIGDVMTTALPTN